MYSKTLELIHHTVSRRAS